MGEARELKLRLRDNEESNDENSSPRPGSLARWIRTAVYSILVLSGTAAASIFGRLYFDGGGESKWMATLVQLVGIPILLPYYFRSLISFKDKATNSCSSTEQQQSNLAVTASVYTVIGLIMVADCYLYSVGLMYIPVSTYSLICASQLAFNALFSYFLNSQKFTPFIINSLVILTVSSVLLVFNSESEDTREKVSRAKYAIGFVCTVGASAVYGLYLSLTQFTIDKVLKRGDFEVVVDMIVWPSLVAGLVAAAALFASGEWAGLGREMGSFGPGRASYVMNLAWTALACQGINVGTVGLIVEVSSLFSNVVSILALPTVPVVAVFVFGESMDGLKVAAMLLAILGLVSYVYQDYLDTQGTEAESQNTERSELH